MGLYRALRLDMERHRLLTFVGGGGKTTSLFALAREGRMAGKTVIIATTTHMLPHPALFLAPAEKGAGLCEQVRRYGILMVGKLTQEGKLGGTENLADCKRAADLVLVEGDGAHQYPCKVPAPYEPVIPPESDAVVAVCGLDCVDQPINRVCHRPEQVAQRLDKPLEARITPLDIERLLLSPQGGRKGVGTLPYRCILNKADTPDRRAWAEEIADRLREQGVIAAITCYAPPERGGGFFSVDE